MSIQVSIEILSELSEFVRLKQWLLTDTDFNTFMSDDLFFPSNIAPRMERNALL